MENETVYMDVSIFQDLTSGSNYTAYSEVVEEIKRGKTYIVENNGFKQRVVLDPNDNLILEQ